MILTTLVENTCLRSDLRGEHGLSLHLCRHDGSCGLFDVGSSARFSENAQTLGVDLAAVDWLVLSHHHRDHGGGLDVFFRRNTHAPVFLRASASSQLLARDASGQTRSIGLRPKLMRRFASRIQTLHLNTEVCQGVFALTQIPHHTPQPEGNRHLFCVRDERIHPDDFDHELVLVVREPQGLVVLTGCGHHGILNMLDAVSAHMPNETILAVIGGFHLVTSRHDDACAMSPAALDQLARTLAESPVQRFITGHCTGAPAFKRLQQTLGSRIQALHTGQRITIGHTTSMPHLE